MVFVVVVLGLSSNGAVGFDQTARPTQPAPTKTQPNTSIHAEAKRTYLSMQALNTTNTSLHGLFII